MKTKKSIVDRQEIYENLYMYIDSEELFKGSLQQVAQKVIDIKQRLRLNNIQFAEDPERYIRIEMDISRCEDGSYPEVNLKGVRLETNGEVSERIKQHEKASKAAKAASATRKKAAKEAELKLYEKLHKIYGKDKQK